MWWIVLYLVWVSCGVYGMTSGPRNSLAHQEKTLVYIGGLLTDLRVLPAVQHALKDINNNPHILPHHTLKFAYTEVPRCEMDYGFQKYIDLVDILPRKLLLLTGLCSPIIERIDFESSRSVSNNRYPRILQVAYVNPGSTFNSVHRQSLFQIFPSQAAFNEPCTKLIEETTSKFGYGWKIGLLYQNTPDYSAPQVEQVAMLTRQQIHNFESASFDANSSTEDIRTVLRKLQKDNVTVLVGSFNETWAKRIFCLAYSEKMYGETYTWLLAGDYDSKWWQMDDTECFPHELHRAMDGMLRLDILPFHTIYMEKKFPELRSFHHSLKSNKHHGYAYDATWAAALALHNVSYFYNQPARIENSNPQDDYLTNSTVNFQNPLWEEAMHRSLSAVSFLGVTGPVTFNTKQERLGHSILVKQFQALADGYDEVNVGEFESGSNLFNLVKYQHRIIQKRIQIISENSYFEPQDPENNQNMNEDHKDPRLITLTGRSSDLNYYYISFGVQILLIFTVNFVCLG